MSDPASTFLIIGTMGEIFMKKEEGNWTTESFSHDTYRNNSDLKK